jgi:pyruvate/oxaloacetate carboxyltransferase
MVDEVDTGREELRALLEGRYGSPPGPIDPAVKRAVGLVSGGTPEEEPPAELDSLKAEAEGLAASEEELLLLALVTTGRDQP